MAKKKKKKKQRPGLQGRKPPSPEPARTPPGGGEGEAAPAEAQAPQAQPETMESLSRKVEENPRDLQGLLDLGKLLLEAGEFEKAADAYGRAISLDDKTADAHHMLAISLIRGGLHSRAMGPLKRAVELAPHIVVYRVNLGKLHMLENRWPEAEKAFVGALRLAHGSQKAEVLELLGRVRASRGLPALTAEQYLSESPETAHGFLGDPYPAPPGLAGAGPGPGREAPAPAPQAQAQRVLMCCVEGSDNFVDSLIAGMRPAVEVEKLVSSLADDFCRAMAGRDVIWLEWAHDMAVAFTNQGRELLAGKRVILRIHSFEIFTGTAEQIDYNQISDLVFVSTQMRDLLLEKKPEIRSQVERIHVIPNGIDLDRFELADRPPGLNVAYVGQLNYKKGPMVLMHAFQALHRMNPGFRLHIAGEFNQDTYEYSMQGFLANNGLGRAVAFHGWVKDIAEWLRDKNYIICTSLSESQGLGLMEAMATGAAPLIYHFPGAEKIYPPEFLWKNLEELRELAGKTPGPEKLRAFVEQNYSLRAQVENTLRMILNREEVVFPGYVWD